MRRRCHWVRSESDSFAIGHYSFLIFLVVELELVRIISFSRHLDYSRRLSTGPAKWQMIKCQMTNDKWVFSTNSFIYLYRTTSYALILLESSARQIAQIRNNTSHEHHNGGSFRMISRSCP